MSNEQNVRAVNQRAGDSPLPTSPSGATNTANEKGVAVNNVAAPQKTLKVSPEAPKAVTQDGFDAKGFIKGSVEGLNKNVEAQTEKQRIHEKLTKAFNSMTLIDRVSYFNEETQELVGTKLRYLPDEDGKTVYDYANDPEVAERLVIVIDENDPQDGSEIEKQVSHYWINPTF